MKTVYGIKVNMDQTWTKDGKRLVITKVKVDPMTVTQVKTEETDGYNAIQVSIGEKTIKANKPLGNHLKKAKLTKNPKAIREVRLQEAPELEVGQALTVSDVLKSGDIVKVTATSKGKGFAGAMKRWNFAGGPKTHGQSDRARAVGSIGQGTTPGRVHKGKKMPGHMGDVTSTATNLQIVGFDEEHNELWVSGSIPGAMNTLVAITKTRDGKAIKLIQTEQAILETADTSSDEKQDTEEKA